MEYEIVRYRPEFREQVLKLQTNLRSSDRASNSEYLAWKYERNPYIKTPFIHLAVSAGDVIGMRGMWGAKWEIGCPAQTFLAPCAGDLVIAADHRNRGLVTKIMEAAADDLADSGCTYVFNFTAGLATQLGSLTTGWRRVGSLEALRLRRPKTRRQRYIGRLCSLPRTTKNLVVSLLAGKGGAGAGRHVSIEDLPRPEAMAELVERIGSDGRLRQIRDQDYFSWRFQNPFSRYQFFFWEDIAVQGYLVLRTRVDDTMGSIVDWEATNMKVRSELLQALIQYGKFDRVAVWTATLPAEVKALLHDMGFRPLKKSDSIGHAHSVRAPRPTVLLKAIGREMQGETDWVMAGRRLLDLKNWDLRMLYADSY